MSRDVCVNEELATAVEMCREHKTSTAIRSGNGGVVTRCVVGDAGLLSLRLSACDVSRNPGSDVARCKRKDSAGHVD